MGECLIYELEVEEAIKLSLQALEKIDYKLREDIPREFIVSKIAVFLDIWDVKYVDKVLKEAGY
ncbi:hypothetical protein H6G33_10330 [Calothrix sp. FACHB-1219]|uniref:hypothetical protein n=1 Tax=unclassified Calothrix TaxID=2619626 RepID=UPI001688103F|nr:MULTISPECIES: hypothetical protein [unclassified Calothrix]MBD2201743.1 hypothetical protein [Calothrix sp. FACHB-168]MBD2217429.1 hypothetical protein [Calothrix sp. FACHB-1219]